MIFVPHKECVTSTDSPCELFSKIEFPTEEFFPPRTIDEVSRNDRSVCTGTCNESLKTCNE